jgi:hypothetical protein
MSGREGERWIVTDPCNKFCKSQGDYARHVKTTHLGEFECVNGLRGSVFIIDWMEGKFWFSAQCSICSSLAGVFGYRVSKTVTNTAIQVIQPPEGRPIV